MTDNIEDSYGEVYYQELQDKSREQRLEWLEVKEEEQQQEIKSIEITIQKLAEVEEVAKGDIAKAEVKQFKNKLTGELANAYEELTEIQQSIEYVNGVC